VEHSNDDGPPLGGPFAVLIPHLQRARDLGFFGPGPIDVHLTHAQGFAEVAGEAPVELLDLGSGGGLPGMVLLAQWPGTRGVLLDSSERRTAFLARAVVALGWQGRVDVVRARAEEAGRDAGMRARFPLIVSRGFGPPPVVAECAAPLLAVHGRLIVSEPPTGSRRWPEAPLKGLGLVPEGLHDACDSHYQTLRQVTLCPEEYPRRVGLPSKRPLW
jgi:16S rRNA (guanine527-N7)-methyltransferase